MLRTSDAMTKTKGNYIRDENKVAGSRKSFGDSALGTPSPRHRTTGVLSSTGLTRKTTKKRKQNEKLNKSNCWQTNGATKGIVTTTATYATYTHTHTPTQAHICIEVCYRSGQHLRSQFAITIAIAVALVVAVC